MGFAFANAELYVSSDTDDPSVWLVGGGASVHLHPNADLVGSYRVGRSGGNPGPRLGVGQLLLSIGF